MADLRSCCYATTTKRLAYGLDADLAAAVHRRIMRPRATAVRVAIEREQTRGGISPDRDPDMLAAAVVAMITYRLLITGEPVDEAFMTSVVQNVLRDSSSPQSD